MLSAPNGIEAKIAVVTGLLAEISTSSFITMKGLEEMATAVEDAKAAFMAGQAEDRRVFDDAMVAHVDVLDETRKSMMLVAESADKLFIEREAALMSVLDGVVNSLVERAWHVRTGEARPDATRVPLAPIEPEQIEETDAPAESEALREVA